MKQTENMKTWRVWNHSYFTTTQQLQLLSWFCSWTLAETDSHLQISQHQASLKHEHFTISYHSHSTLLPQNVLQLQLHP